MNTPGEGRPPIRVRRRSLAGTADVRREQRPSQAASTPLGHDMAEQLVHDRLAAGHPIDGRVGDLLPVDLGEDEVAVGIEARLALPLLAQERARRGVRDVVGAVGGPDDGRRGLVFRVVAVRPTEAQARDVGGVRELQPGRGGRRRRSVGHGRHDASLAAGATSAGSGFVQSYDVLAISNPSDVYRVIAWFGLSPSTPR